jgi:hypothetical protein
VAEEQALCELLQVRLFEFSRISCCMLVNVKEQAATEATAQCKREAESKLQVSFHDRCDDALLY